MTAYATPQADPTRVVGRRILAYGIDLLLMAGVVLAVLFPAFRDQSETVSSAAYRCASTPTFGTTTDRRPISSSICLDDGTEVRYIPEDEADAFTLRVYGVGFGMQVLNLVLLQSVIGASIGKAIVGLRVVRADGNKAGFGWMALRWILLNIDSFCCFLPGAILVFTTKGHRRLGDMAAGTYVVRRADVGRPVGLGTGATSYPAAGYGAAGYGGGYPQQTWGGGYPAAPAPTGDGPIWDEARNTYIQFDRSTSAWVQWDADASQWRPIDH